MVGEYWALKLERDSEEKRQEQTTAERLDIVLDTAFCEVQADAIGRDMEPMLWCGDQQLVYQDLRNYTAMEELDGWSDESDAED